MPDNDFLKERYRSEIALAVVAALATVAIFFVDKSKLDDVFIVDAVVATLLVCVGIMKAHALRVARILIKAERRTGAKTSEIARILESLGGPAFDHAINVVDSTLERLERAREGYITVEPSTYFKWLIDEMNTVRSGSRVLAVSSISTLRWTDDPREAKYLEANIAASERRVDIHRVFLINRSDMQGASGPKIREILKHQKSKGISVDVVWDTAVSHELHEDFVLFEACNTAYKDEHDPFDPTRIMRGERITNKNKLTEYHDNFGKLLLSCLGSEELLKLLDLKALP